MDVETNIVRTLKFCEIFRYIRDKCNAHIPSFVNRFFVAVRKAGSTKVNGGLLIPDERSLESTSNMMAEYSSVSYAMSRH